MHILLLGYLFVIAMWAAASGSWWRGGMIGFFFALLPCWLLFLRLRHKRHSE